MYEEILDAISKRIDVLTSGTRTSRGVARRLSRAHCQVKTLTGLNGGNCPMWVWLEQDPEIRRLAEEQNLIWHVGHDYVLLKDKQTGHYRDFGYYVQLPKTVVDFIEEFEHENYPQLINPGN